MQKLSTGYIDMSKYFESISTNENVILIDDTFLCMQVCGVFYGVNAVYHYEYNEDVYYLDTAGVNAKNVVWGVGLDELSDAGIVGFDISRWSNTQIRIRLFKGGRLNDNDQWTKRDDALMNKMVFYAFTDQAKLTSSEHLNGFEIYDSTGNVLYSSGYRALNVLSTFSFGKSNEMEGLILENANRWGQEIINTNYSWRTRGVIIPTGHWMAVDRNTWSVIAAVGVDVHGKGGNLCYCTMNAASKYRRPGPYSGMSYNTLGALIGELV